MDDRIYAVPLILLAAYFALPVLLLTVMLVVMLILIATPFRFFWKLFKWTWQ